MEHLIKDGLYTITGPHEVDDQPGFGIGCVVRYDDDFNDINQYRMFDILNNDFWWVDANAITPYVNPFQVGDIVRLADWVGELDVDGMLGKYRGVLYTVKEINGDHIVVTDAFSSTLLAPIFQLVERPTEKNTLPKEITSVWEGTISRDQFLSWLFTKEKLADSVPPYELHRLMDGIITLEEFARHPAIAWELIQQEKGTLQHRIDIARDEVTALEARIASLEEELADYD